MTTKLGLKYLEKNIEHFAMPFIFAAAGGIVARVRQVGESAPGRRPWGRISTLFAVI